MKKILAVMIIMMSIVGCGTTTESPTTEANQNQQPVETMTLPRQQKIVSTEEARNVNPDDFWIDNSTYDFDAYLNALGYKDWPGVIDYTTKGVRYIITDGDSGKVVDGENFARHFILHYDGMVECCFTPDDGKTICQYFFFAQYKPGGGIHPAEGEMIKVRSSRIFQLKYVYEEGLPDELTHDRYDRFEDTGILDRLGIRDKFYIEIPMEGVYYLTNIAKWLVTNENPNDDIFAEKVGNLGSVYRDEFNYIPGLDIGALVCHNKGYREYLCQDRK